ncbi:MAG: hypothetical protein ABIH92_05870 [Nanoarchaeota archaeon]
MKIKIHFVVIIKACILLQFFFFIQNTSALSLDSPGSVNLNEIFFVSISEDKTSNENYDVKIYVHNSQDKSILRSEYISEVYKGEWQDSWYYLLKSYPNEKTYEIKVTNSPGNREICLKLRKSSSGDGNALETCNKILVLSSENSEPVMQKLSYPNQETDKIVLNSKTGNEEIPTTSQTKQEKKRLAIIYGFLAFCIVLIILLALKRL